MASELISDDFNRSDRSLSSGVNAEGWSWLSIGFNSLSVQNNAVTSSSAIGWRRYRATEEISSVGTALGAEIDVVGGTHAQLLLRVAGSNFVHATFNHETGDILVAERIAGNNGFLGQHTIAPVTPPYKFGAYAIGGQVHVLIDDVLVFSGANSADPSLFFSTFVGIGADVNTFGPVVYDNFNAGIPWLLGMVEAPASALNTSDPAVRRRVLDEQRRSALLGGRQNTILTSPLGLADEVPVGRVHLMGRCG